MTSCERVLEYTTLATEEADLACDGACRPSGHPMEGAAVADAWPQTGSVDLTNMTLRYGVNDPAVLHNITASVHSGEKIG